MWAQSKLSPLERISERISEQIVDVPVPRGTVSAPLSAVAVKRQKNRKKKKPPEGDFFGVEADPDFRALVSRLRGSSVKTPLNLHAPSHFQLA